MEEIDSFDSTLPDGNHASYEEAYTALKEHSMANGYGFKLKRSTPPQTVMRTRFYYQCDRSGKYQSKALVRDTSTRTTGCTFNMIIFQKGDGWILQVKNRHHNHSPSINPSAHNIHRRRTPAQKECIEAMSRAGIAPKHILTAIRQQDPNTLVSATDIHNDKKVMRISQLQGRTPIEALIDKLSLSSSKWVFDVKTDTGNHVQSSFFSHKKQVELLLANPDVLLMDCTYRTNRYNLALLHILGCTNLQTFFSAGFCFLRNETYLDYHWAISTFLAKTKAFQPRVFISDQEQALKSVAYELLPRVPQLLCV